MSKRKSKTSKPVKLKKNVDPLHCGTITAAMQTKMRKAAERQARIESGLSQAAAGTGAHWKGKRGENRANRRASKQQVAKGLDD